MRINYLSKKEAASLAARIRSLGWGEALKEEKPRKALEIEEKGMKVKIYCIGGLIIGEKNETLFPTLHEARNREALAKLPSMIVDMGAVPHIVNGADVMRPGVREFQGDFRKGDLVVVRDERHHKPLAIAISLEDSEKCKEMRRGKVAENIHHVDDRIWKLVSRISHVIERA